MCKMSEGRPRASEFFTKYPADSEEGTQGTQDSERPNTSFTVFGNLVLPFVKIHVNSASSLMICVIIQMQ